MGVILSRSSTTSRLCKGCYGIKKAVIERDQSNLLELYCNRCKNNYTKTQWSRTRLSPKIDIFIAGFIQVWTSEGRLVYLHWATLLFVNVLMFINYLSVWIRLYIGDPCAKNLWWLKYAITFRFLFTNIFISFVLCWLKTK